MEFAVNRSPGPEWFPGKQLAPRSIVGPGPGKIPPTGLPLNSERPRPALLHFTRVISAVINQGADLPGPVSDWLDDRQSVYLQGPGRKWNPMTVAYAAARDLLSWQFKCGESTLWTRAAEKRTDEFEGLRRKDGMSRRHWRQ